ncbi:hypothetical protein AAC387_Pa08g1032 [Persea americana]
MAQKILTFSRVLVNIDLSKPKPPSILMNLQGEGELEISVEYEHCPCSLCLSPGHSQLTCPLSSKPPISKPLSSSSSTLDPSKTSSLPPAPPVPDSPPLPSPPSVCQSLSLPPQPRQGASQSQSGWLTPSQFCRLTPTPLPLNNPSCWKTPTPLPINLSLLLHSSHNLLLLLFPLCLLLIWSPLVPLAIPIHQTSTPTPLHQTFAPTEKANSPSRTDLPCDVVSKILQKIPTPTIDISNPFSILDHCSLLDPIYNPSIYGRNLQASSEGNSFTDLPPGLELPPEPHNPSTIPLELPTFPSINRPPDSALSPAEQSYPCSSPTSLAPPTLLSVHSTSTSPLATTTIKPPPTANTIKKIGKGNKSISSAPSTGPITRRSRGKKTSLKSSNVKSPLLEL